MKLRKKEHRARISSRKNVRAIVDLQLMPISNHCLSLALTIKEIRSQTAKAHRDATNRAAAHDEEDEAAMAQMLLRGLVIEDDRYGLLAHLSHKSLKHS